MSAITHEWFNVKRSDTFPLIPLGDVHLGNTGCNEALFTSLVKRIAENESCYWIGMGDYCEFINIKDPRFDPSALADWLQLSDLLDLARAQRDRFLEMVAPISSRCLALVEGNHERAIRRHCERDVYLEIVNGVKEAGSIPSAQPLALGVTGWLRLNFHRSKKRQRGTCVDINLHHGFVGGRLAGAKALNMQRWLWNHDADLVVFGHSHTEMAQVEAVEVLNKEGNIKHKRRIGCYAGTFLQSPEYAQEKGYFPAPTGHVEIQLRPGAAEQADRIKVVT